MEYFIVNQKLNTCTYDRFFV